MAVNKKSFYESITQDTIFNEDFFKKVLGYSMYDVPFLEAMDVRLTEIGRKGVIEQYNTWYAAWKAEDDKKMKEIAEWYHKEVDKQFEKQQKKQKEKAVEECRERLKNLSNEELIRMLSTN